MRAITINVPESALQRTVFCVGSARLVREVSPLLDCVARIRWVADAAGLQRAVGASANEVFACIAEHTTDDAALTQMLQELGQRRPNTRRIVVTDHCNLAVVRKLIDTQLVHALVYRPLEASDLRQALGLMLPPTRQTQRSPASLG